MVPCQRSIAVSLGWGEQEDVGGLHHLVGTSPINCTAITHAGYVIRKCSYACSYLLLLSLIIFFSLPAITVALTVSYSTPSQCGPFNVTWDHPSDFYKFYILPLNGQPEIVDDQVHDKSEVQAHEYLVDQLKLKTGTQFVVSLGDGALFSSPLAIYKIRVLT